MTYEDGKYVLMKDPNKPVMRIYAVPANTFEEDSSEEDDDDDKIGIRVAAQQDDDL